MGRCGHLSYTHMEMFLFVILYVFIGHKKKDFFSREKLLVRFLLSFSNFLLVLVDPSEFP